jgi:hypothetical protein
MINKHNLAIASIAPKDSWKYSLNGILVTPKETAATDGHILAVVTTPDIADSDYPSIPGLSECKAPESVIMPAAVANEVLKALPKKAKSPILENAIVRSETVEDKTTYKAAVTDCTNTRIINFEPVEGRFLKYSQAIPDEKDNEISFCVDALLLIKLLKAIGPLAENGKKQQPVVIRVKDYTEPIRIDSCPASTDNTQRAIGVIMPMNYPDKDLHGVIRETKDSLIEQSEENCRKALETIESTNPIIVIE